MVNAAVRRAIAAVTVALVAQLGSFGLAHAEAACPPGVSGRACSDWLLQRAEEELAAAVERKQGDIDRRSTLIERTAAAKAYVIDAHREWLRFREAECRAQAAFETLISAMTPEAWTTSCRHRMTRRRIEELSAR